MRRARWRRPETRSARFQRGWDAAAATVTQAAWPPPGGRLAELDAIWFLSIAARALARDTDAWRVFQAGPGAPVAERIRDLLVEHPHMLVMLTPVMDPPARRQAALGLAELAGDLACILGHDPVWFARTGPMLGVMLEASRAQKTNPVSRETISALTGQSAAAGEDPS